MCVRERCGAQRGRRSHPELVAKTHIRTEVKSFRGSLLFRCESEAACSLAACFPRQPALSQRACTQFVACLQRSSRRSRAFVLPFSCAAGRWRAALIMSAAHDANEQAVAAAVERARVAVAALVEPPASGFLLQVRVLLSRVHSRPTPSPLPSPPSHGAQPSPPPRAAPRMQHSPRHARPRPTPSPPSTCSAALATCVPSPSPRWPNLVCALSSRLFHFAGHSVRPAGFDAAALLRSSSDGGEQQQHDEHHVAVAAALQRARDAVAALVAEPPSKFLEGMRSALQQAEAALQQQPRGRWAWTLPPKSHLASMPADDPRRPAREEVYAAMANLKAVGFSRQHAHRLPTSVT
jgi:hypothetical protein